MTFWGIILILTTLALYLIPLLPGLVEIFRPTDTQPLRVSQEYDSNPLHFADGFRKYVKKNFADLSVAQNHNGTLKDGTKFQLVGESGIPTLKNTNGNGSKNSSQSEKHKWNRLLISTNSLGLPAGEAFETEIYSLQNVSTGERSQFRALLSDQSLNIREHCTVMRWAHSEGDMIVGAHSHMYGRATSRQSIILNEDVHFERLHAPIIMSTARQNISYDTAAKEHILLDHLPDVKIQSGKRWVLNGHLDFPAEHRFEGDIITGTTATIGDYALLDGSLKCNAHDDVVHHLQNTGVVSSNNRKNIALCDIGNNVTINGSVISSHDMTIGENCRIFGPGDCRKFIDY